MRKFLKPRLSKCFPSFNYLTGISKMEIDHKNQPLGKGIPVSNLVLFITYLCTIIDLILTVPTWKPVCHTQIRSNKNCQS